MYDWTQIKSGMPQGSVLGPLLFIIFINNIDDIMSGMILKFADDTKMLGKLWMEEDIDKLKTDLNAVSVINKRHDLVLFCLNKLSIIDIIESWLVCNIRDSKF